MGRIDEPFGEINIFCEQLLLDFLVIGSFVFGRVITVYKEFAGLSTRLEFNFLCENKKGQLVEVSELVETQNFQKSVEVFNFANRRTRTRVIESFFGRPNFHTLASHDCFVHSRRIPYPTF